MTHLTGIMADSHGNSETILAALAAFKNLKCRTIYHLGDICDSTRPETAEACLKPLQDRHVIAIKGNNDHVIVANHLGREKAPVSPNILRYLQNLPLVAYSHAADLTHSLPFVAKLGLSCMIGTMSEKAAQ